MKAVLCLLFITVAFAIQAEVVWYARLTDTYGDGWNGATLDVYVNGNLVLDDMTLNSGYGPAIYSFPVNHGDQLTTVFTPGTWQAEERSASARGELIRNDTC